VTPPVATVSSAAPAGLAPDRLITKQKRYVREPVPEPKGFRHLDSHMKELGAESGVER